jgi:hypothetical protein
LQKLRIALYNMAVGIYEAIDIRHCNFPLFVDYPGSDPTMGAWR